MYSFTFSYTNDKEASVGFTHTFENERVNTIIHLVKQDKETGNEPQVWRVLLDDEFEAKLKIIKKDDETKKSVLLPNTEFKVYDLDNEKYVEQVTTYPATTVHNPIWPMRKDN